MAPDGDRVAVLSTLLDGSDSRIDLAGVVRTGGGAAAAARRRRCGSARSVTRATSLAWLDDRTLATLGVLDGKTLQPAVLTVGGEVRALTPVQGRRQPSRPPAASATSGWSRRAGGCSAGPARSGSTAGPATDLAVAAG